MEGEEKEEFLEFIPLREGCGEQERCRVSSPAVMLGVLWCRSPDLELHFPTEGSLAFQESHSSISQPSSILQETGTHAPRHAPQWFVIFEGTFSCVSSRRGKRAAEHEPGSLVAFRWPLVFDPLEV